ncbi:hypothetical protein L7F22_061200 [Adiantum nelumboides]|nr:hypothetical protein [Adiantum nelumboides]
MQVVKLIVIDSSETREDDIKDKPATFKHKLDKPVLDLVRGIQELNLHLKAVKLEVLSSKGSTSEPKQQPSRKDWDRYAATYGLQVFNKVVEDDFKTYGDLWPYALKMAEGGKGDPPQQIPEEEEPEIVDEAKVMEPEQILLHGFRQGSKKQQTHFFLNFKDRGTHKAVWVDEDFFQPGHIATDCPQKKRPADSDDKEDKKGKKPKSMVGLVPDMVGDKPNSDSTELCRSWGMIVSLALIMWKGLICFTGSESPVVVVLSGSMEPGFQRGDILFLNMGNAPVRAGEIVVFNVDGRKIPIVHRVIKVHEDRKTGEVEVLTKGDNNYGDDRLLYADGQLWLNRHHIMGRSVGFLPYVGWVTIFMTEKPVIKYILIAALGVLVLVS